MTVLTAGAAVDVGLVPDRIERAREMLHVHVASGRAPAATAIVARRGTVVLAEAAGEQRPGGPALALEHLWPLASACKPLTAAALMSLAEEGRVGIHQPIVDYLPELAGRTHDDVLVHHLLTHTAGWESPMFTGRLTEFLASGELPPQPADRDLLSHIFLTMGVDPIRYRPVGEEMAYANVNYELVAEIIRRVTGGTLDAAMRERIFDPLGMVDSAVIVPESLGDRLVQRAPELPFGSAEAPGNLDFQSELFQAADLGGAGVFAAPRDLAVFAQAILDGGAYNGERILAPSTVRSMTTNQIPGTPARFGEDTTVREGSWGYGFSIIGEQRWPWFGGGLVPPGSATHPGAGGISYWIDFENEIVGVFFEVITEMSEMLEPVSGLSHRFQDVITGGGGGMTISADPVTPTTVGVSPARLDDAATLMQRQHDEGRSPMLVAVVARHGEVVFAHAVGDQRPGGPPLTIDSVFPIASQSKPMTAAVLLCLVERGLVGLNEPAALHVPELGTGDNAEVMVHHLLTHTSGWNDDDIDPVRDERQDEIIDSWDGESDLLGQIMFRPGLEVARRTPAGELMQYCNFNYNLLGEIIRRATGDTLDAAMRTYLFEPIGMTDSAVIVPERLEDRVIERPAGIPFGPDHPASPISFDDPLWAASDNGAGGVHATAIDCVRFAQMILDGGVVGDRRVLSPDAVRVMTHNQIPGVPAEVLDLRRDEASWGYGYGITGPTPWLRFAGATVDTDSLRHGGAGGIDVWIDPSTGIVGAYFEMVTEWDWDHGPLSWAAHRFEDVITAAAVD